MSLALAGCSGSTSIDGGLGGAENAVSSNAAVVAVLETVAGTQSPFVVKGTVPVPPGTYVNKKLVPFTVLDWDGTAAPTQVELVTSYPKVTDGADVVEVLAKVHVPPTAAPGTKISYEVVANPHSKVGFRLSQEMLKIVGTPNSILLVTHDVFGNEYRADLLAGSKQDFKKKNQNVLRNGEVAATLRTHGVLKPTNPGQIGQSNGPLHHMFGAHAYTSLWLGDDYLSLDLRVHNGLSGLDASDPSDNPNTDLYFADIELWIPKDWQMFQQTPDPGLGPKYDKLNYTVFPIVAPLPNGKMHFMPQQGQFHRRLALAPQGSTQLAQAVVDELGRAFCKKGPSPTGGELWSWWNPQTARYFPMSHRLPELDYIGVGTILAKDQQNLANARNIMLTGGTGNFPLSNPVMGWAHPWGSSYGGMTGGSEVQQYDGVTTAFAASVDGYRYSQLTHRMYTDRQCDVLFNLDGTPTKLPQWLKQGPSGTYLPGAFSQTPPTDDFFGFKSADTSQVAYVKSQNLQPPYEAQLDGFMPVDFQHYTRYTRSAKVLVWLGNDSIAKDDVMMRAELFRMSYHMYPNGYYGYIGTGMLKDWTDVQADPGTGFEFGRGEGWGLDISNAAYAIADKSWRDEARPWFESIVDLVAQGQSSCNGFIQSLISSKMLNGTYHVRQAIEQGIVESALKGAIETVFRGVDTGRTAQTEYVLEKSFYAMIGPMAWSDALKGPHSYLAVGPLDKSQGTFCGSIPSDGSANGVNYSQAYGSFTYAYELTGDQQFLQKASVCLGAASASGLLQALESGGFNLLDSRAPLIASCQELGY